MSVEVTICNRQRARPVSTAQLRRLTEGLLGDCLNIVEGELSIVLLSARDMAVINHRFLQHAGSTDVITFNYAEPKDADDLILQGEIFVCVAEAVAQARRFRTSWPAELARYVVHGILHLLGYDDRRAADRRRMKREELRLLRELGRQFPLRNLAQRPAGR